MNQAFNGKKRLFPGQSGNALWFLLVAIALLAALTLTITHFSDTAQQTGTTELDRIHASQILRYAKSFDSAINQMQGRDISVNDISFENTTVSGYTNANCTSDACKLFATAGGGLAYTAPDTSWLDGAQSAQAFYGQWIFTGKTCVQGVGDQNEALAVSCSGNSDPSDDDLVMMLPYISENLCVQINSMIGVANPGGVPPVGSSNTWDGSPQYTGTFADSANIGVSNNNLYRKASGCLQGAGTPAAGTYVFYHVLVAR